MSGTWGEVLERCRRLVKKLEKKKPVVFCGDLNVAHTEIDLARPKENEGMKGFTKEEREGLNNFIEKFILSHSFFFKRFFVDS